MTLVIRVDDAPGEQRVALISDGRLREFYLARQDAPDGLGDFYIGRITAKIPAMAGAFVKLSDATGFLPDTAGAADVSEGALLPVRITRAALAGKGPRVAACAAPVGARLDRVALLARGPTPLDELLAAFPGAPVEHGPFDEAMEAEIEGLAAPACVLASGVRASFAVTPALTAIDLDSAGATAGREGKAGAQMRSNRVALPDLVRQIVLRNLSGAILVDFAGMPARSRRALAPDLASALAADRLGARPAGFSPLGFAEISRPRLRPPLHEMTNSPLGQGLAALREVLAEARAAPARRLALRARPGVVEALRSAPTAMAALARLTAYPLVLRADPALLQDWVIEDAP